MLVRQAFQRSGGQSGWLYWLDQGAGIPMHAHHDEKLQHDVRVLTGSVCVYGPNGIGSHVVRARSILHFDSGQPHEIQALEDGTEIWNVLLHESQPMAFEESRQILEQDTQLTHQIEDFSNPRPVACQNQSRST